MAALVNLVWNLRSERVSSFADAAVPCIVSPAGKSSNLGGFLAVQCGVPPDCADPLTALNARTAISLRIAATLRNRSRFLTFERRINLNDLSLSR